jgi:hypothetical protein
MQTVHIPTPADRRGSTPLRVSAFVLHDSLSEEISLARRVIQHFKTKAKPPTVLVFVKLPREKRKLLPRRDQHTQSASEAEGGPAAAAPTAAAHGPSFDDVMIAKDSQHAQFSDSAVFACGPKSWHILNFMEKWAKENGLLVPSERHLRVSAQPAFVAQQLRLQSEVVSLCVPPAPSLEWDEVKHFVSTACLEQEAYAQEGGAGSDHCC